MKTRSHGSPVVAEAAHGLSAGKCVQRSECHGNTPEGEARAIDSRNGIGKGGGIYFETGTVPLKLKSYQKVCGWPWKRHRIRRPAGSRCWI